MSIDARRTKTYVVEDEEEEAEQIINIRPTTSGIKGAHNQFSRQKVTILCHLVCFNEALHLYRKCIYIRIFSCRSRSSPRKLLPIAAFF